MKRIHLLVLCSTILSAACAVPTTGDQSADLRPVENKVACLTHVDFDVVCSSIPNSTSYDYCEDAIPLTECVDETTSGVNGDCTFSHHYKRTIIEHVCVAQPVENIHPL